MLSSSLVYVIALAISITYAADPAATGGADAGSATDAKILASKFLLSRYAVEDKEFVVDYRLYNVGDKIATKVTLDDTANFHPQYFETIKGVLSVEWDRIPPGSNVSHSVILKVGSLSIGLPRLRGPDFPLLSATVLGYHQLHGC